MADFVASTCLTLREIENELTEVTAADWFSLGVQLGVRSARLKEIEMNFPVDTQRRKTEVLDFWLRNAPEISWQKLAQAVEAMGGYATVVQKLRRKMPPMPRENLQVIGASPPSQNGITDGHQNLTSNGAVNSHDETTSQQGPCNGHRGIYHKIKGDPPHIQGLDVDEDELIFETRDIQGEFNNLFTKVHIFLENKGVTVDAFVLFLENVPGYGGKPLFDAEISDLREAMNLTSVFRIVRKHCSWFNHLFLSDIIKTYCEGNKRLEKAQRDYCTQLQRYCKHRVKMCPLKNGFGFRGKKEKMMIVKVDREWEVIHIQQLDEVVFSLARILKVRREILKLVCAESGCVQLTLLVPSYIPDAVFPLTTEQETAMKEMGVLDLQCGTYHFSCQSYNLKAQLVKFSQLLQSADGHDLELFHTGGEEMLYTALNFWIHCFLHPLNSLLPEEFAEGPDDDDSGTIQPHVHAHSCEEDKELKAKRDYKKAMLHVVLLLNQNHPVLSGSTANKNNCSAEVEEDPSRRQLNEYFSEPSLADRYRGIEVAKPQTFQVPSHYQCLRSVGDSNPQSTKIVCHLSDEEDTLHSFPKFTVSKASACVTSSEQGSHRRRSPGYDYVETNPTISARLIKPNGGSGSSSRLPVAADRITDAQKPSTTSDTAHSDSSFGSAGSGGAIVERTRAESLSDFRRPESMFLDTVITEFEQITQELDSALILESSELEESEGIDSQDSLHLAKEDDLEAGVQPQAQPRFQFSPSPVVTEKCEGSPDMMAKNRRFLSQMDTTLDNQLNTKETDEHQVETPNVARIESDSSENQKTSDERHELTTKESEENEVETPNGHLPRMEGGSSENEEVSNDRSEDYHVTIDEHQVETPNKKPKHVPRMEGASTEIQMASNGRSVGNYLSTKEDDEDQVETPNTHVPRMKGASPEIQRESNDRSEVDGQELLQACTSEQWDLAEVLIVSGSTLEAQDKDGKTALHICCIKGNIKMVKLLIEHGANVTAKDQLDNCCLHHKETLKKSEITSLVIPAFLQKGWSVDQPNKNDVTPLLVACQSGEICYQAALVLITHDARVDGLPTINEKPLICASARGNIKLVELLLTYGADINQKDGRDGSTALIQACLCNHPGIVRVLLEKSLNVNLADKDGTTALAAAVSKNAYEMVQMLIEKAADVNCIRQCGGVVGSYEETPLASACARGYRDVAELLIHNGANVNFLCSDTVPPIGFAIICRQQHMIKFLLEVEGYDKSIYGLSIPVDIAVRAENYAAAKILLDARGGPKLSLQEAQQNLLTQLAGHIELIQNLPESELEVEEPAVRRDQMRDQAVKVEEVLQTFSQICMTAITSNTNCEQLLEISKALGAPNHITSFIQEYSRSIQRQDILKAKFLGSDSGMSPANFFITHQFIDTGSFHAHATEFFPDGTEKFYEELVWTFQQISGGEDLPCNANRVLERLFRGQFSLNVRTATMRELKSQLPFQHHSWSRPQLLPTALSHEDQCVSTALPWPTRPGATLPIPALPGPARPGATLPIPALPGPARPGPTLRALPGPILPGTTLPRPPLAGPEWPRPELSKPALNGVEMGQSSSTAFSFTDSQPIVPDGKQNETEIRSAELQQRVTSNVESILKKQHSLPAKLPNRVLVNATMPKLKTKSYSSDSHYHSSEHDKPTSVSKAELTEKGSLPSPLQDSEETNENGENSRSVSAGEITVNQSNTAGSSGSMCPETPETERKSTIDENSGSISEITANQSITAEGSGSMRPETPENERRSKISEVATQRKSTREICRTTMNLPTAYKKTEFSRARKPPNGTLKSGPQTTMKGHPKTPGAEGGHSQRMILQVTFLGKRIGEGAFGFVEKVKVNGKICAGKHFKDDCNFKEQRFQKEFKIMQTLQHKHIVIYYGYHKLPKHNPQCQIKSPVLIMEYLVTNLHDFLLSESHKDLPLQRKVDLLSGIAQGLDYLHSMGVIHRDLTAKNVLLDSKAVPKISDFGNSCVTGTFLGSELHSKSLTRCPGTLNYMAPEAQSRTDYGTEIDIFSFGHLSLFVGIQKSPASLKPATVPDAKSGKLQALDEVERREDYFTLLYRIVGETHPLVILIKSCLSNWTAERPKAHELVSQLQAMQTDLPLPPLNIKKEQAPAPQGMHKGRK